MGGSNLRKKQRGIKIFDAQAATGNGTAFQATEYKSIAIVMSTASSANMTIKCKTSLNETEPTWSSAAAVDNEWDYTAMFNTQDASKVDGDTGVAYSGTDAVEQFIVNVDNVEWVNFEVTAYTAGNITVKVFATDNE